MPGSPLPEGHALPLVLIGRLYLQLSFSPLSHSERMAKASECEVLSDLTLFPFLSKGPFCIKSINEPQKTRHLCCLSGEKYCSAVALNSIQNVQKGGKPKNIYSELPRQGLLWSGLSSPAPSVLHALRCKQWGEPMTQGLE